MARTVAQGRPVRGRSDQRLADLQHLEDQPSRRAAEGEAARAERGADLDRRDEHLGAERDEAFQFGVDVGDLEDRVGQAERRGDARAVVEDGDGGQEQAGPGEVEEGVFERAVRRA